MTEEEIKAEREARNSFGYTRYREPNEALDTRVTRVLESTITDEEWTRVKKAIIAET